MHTHFHYLLNPKIIKKDKENKQHLLSTKETKFHSMTALVFELFASYLSSYSSSLSPWAHIQAYGT